MTPIRSIFMFLGCATLSIACGDDGGSSMSEVDAGPLQSESPPKRSDIHGAIDPDTGVFAVFGGDDGPIVNQIPMATFRNDTWLFEPGIGWTEVADPGPSARGRHAVAYDNEADRMLIFGGRFRTAGGSGDYTVYKDLWAFDLASREWTELSAGGGPAPRYFAAAAYSGGNFYVYGGGTNTDPLALDLATDLWKFDGASWSEVVTAGAAPDPNRLFIAYTHDTKRNRLIAFGGQIGDFVSPAENDLYALDLATGSWVELDDGTGTAPSGRFSSLMAYDAEDDRYIVLGGHADAGVANDLWAFSPESNTWQLLYQGDTFTGAALGCLGNPREIPKNYVTEDLSAPERRSGGFLGAFEGKLWLFGGESDCSDHLDDTWSFDFATSSWSEVLEATSGESCARRADDCQCLCL